jgi:hypothetical protein
MAPLGQARLDQIADEALAILKAAGRETSRVEVENYIEDMRDYVPMPSAGEAKKQLVSYRKNLAATKRTFVRWLNFIAEGRVFLKQLDLEIKRIDAELKLKQKWPVRHGGKRSDPFAAPAVQVATRLLAPEWYSGSRRLPPPLTRHGPWHRLSMLFHEAATGTHGENAVFVRMRMMMKFKHRRPRPLSLLC